MNKATDTNRYRGITFGELLAALLISGMVISATAMLYVNVRKSLISIEKRIFGALATCDVDGASRAIVVPNSNYEVI